MAQHQDFSKRYPRERFSGTLRRLCERLDARHEVEFDYADPKGTLVPIHGRLLTRARVLWAFGSWAHGAKVCRDLDLALDLKTEWVGGCGWTGAGGKVTGPPRFEPARKALMPAPPLTHILDARYIREHGPSDEFVIRPDMLKPIWLAPDLTEEERESYGLAGLPLNTWDGRLQEIKLDPNYQRPTRPGDLFPLHIEQTSMELWHLERAVLAHQQGLIDWTFLPHGARRDEEGKLNEAERNKIFEHLCSDKSQVSRVLVATRDVRRQHRAAIFWYGRYGVWARMFKDFPTSCFVITPKWTAQGPNGSLVVTKGPNYSAAAVEAFVAANK